MQLASGRSLTARLDARTDSDRLWLRWQRDSAVLARPIEWDSVVQARVAGEDISGEEFHALVAAIRKDSPLLAQLQAAPSPIVLRGSSDAADTAPIASGLEHVSQQPRVRSLAIDATVANWDADVNVDGLMVHVYPLDDLGRIVPVDGTLEVDLTAQRQSILRRRQPFRDLGRWTRRVREDDFGLDGAEYRLRFQRVHPEFDTSISPYGAVHARLTVPGHGTFEATASTVRIRPSSIVRDELQRATGRRFFPQERTGRR